MSAQRHNAQCCITGYRPALRTAVLLIISYLLLAAAAPAQTQPTPSSDATPEAAKEERELNEARRSNEKAQADYYLAQTKKLQQTDPPKTFWRALSDNAAILGALTAALVALFTLVVNQRTALRGRKDTEFYEALKRFGDKDSPTVRASAVAMLTEMSDLSFFAWRWRKKAPWWRPDKNMIRYPYFDTVLDQFITGLLIEENSVVIYTIDTALRRIMPRNSQRSADRLRESNKRLKQDITTLLTAFLESRGATNRDEVEEEVWEELTALTRCSVEGLKAIVANNPWEETDWTEDPDQRLREIQNSLIDVGRRLNQNVKLCEMLLNARSESAIEPLDFSYAYLANVSLLNLRNINFSCALMPRAHLGGAKLAGANLQGAVLEGLIIYSNELTETKLYGAHIDAFEGNWWRADYLRTGDTQGVVDERLIEKYILHKGELTPEQLKEAHPTVKTYIAERNASREDAAAKLE